MNAKKAGVRKELYGDLRSNLDAAQWDGKNLNEDR